MLSLSLSLTSAALQRASTTPASIFGPDDEWVWLEPSTSYAYQDTSGAVPSEIGDPVGLIIDRSGNGYDAVRVTNDDYRVTLVQADNGDLLFQNDEIDDEMQITFSDLGTECTIAYVTQSEIRLLEDQTLNGSYTLPQHDLLGFVAVDRAMTKVEKIRLIRYLASKAQGVRYGADLDDMQLACINAVDVFVYDTSLDSDGGAWRNGALAQASSWYNEALNTATRGSRREFPAVAVIVAESNKVTIYDGDDPSLPMWMVFNATSGGFVYVAGCTSVVALNGYLFAGMNTGAVGCLPQASFVSDSYFFRNSNGTKYNLNTIANRNITGGPYASGSIPPIVNSLVNEVAMTILPDAPTDPATGLPVPTIAVSANGGVSVIKDDGAVWDITDAVGVHYSASASVVFLPSNQLRFSQELTNSRKVSSVNIPSSDREIYFWRIGGEGLSADDGLTLWGTKATSTSGDLFGEMAHLGKNAGGHARLASDGSVGTPLGLTRTLDNLTNPADSMVAYAASDYATGWLPGDIKGAFLADTDDTDLVGSGELVANGTFDTDTTGWSSQLGAVITHTGSAMQVQSTGANSLAYLYITADLDKQYIISVELVSSTGGTSLIQIGGTSGLSTALSVGVNTFTIPAGRANNKLDLTPGNGETAVFDNISVKLADADRSVNNSGLIVNGTITRGPVADGAELVGYSGFSASNYLEQPYNSDLDFGTGDFCVMGWFSVQDAGANKYILTRSSYTTGWVGSAINLSLNGSEQIDFKITDDGFTTSDVITSSAVSVGVWHFVCALRNGATLKLYVDGVLAGTATITAATGSLSNASAKLGIGNLPVVQTVPFKGSLALLRISATAPTAAQIAKIYEDEKVLFQENAACTLYGASDAVTALAHDPGTDLLHVGTSAGRSVFRGLERIQNTTTSVSKAISAVNGLIAEK